MLAAINVLFYCCLPVVMETGLRQKSPEAKSVKTLGLPRFAPRRLCRAFHGQEDCALAACIFKR
jgi:hypothetical protein